MEIKLATVSAAPPVDPDSKLSLNPTSLAEPESKRTMEDPAPQATARPKMQGPLAVSPKRPNRLQKGINGPQNKT